MIDPDCTAEKCEAAPTCTVCHLRKPPIGRSVAPEMANGMCGVDCKGFYEEPRSGHLWPGEIKPRGKGKDYRAVAGEAFDTLKRIAKAYMTPEQIRRAIERRNDAMYGLGYEEALEMAYENIQAEARDAIARMRRP